MSKHRDMFAFWAGWAAGFCSLTEGGWGGILVAIGGLIALYFWRKNDTHPSATARNEKD